MHKNTCLITGVAGFIGYFLAKRLLEEGHSVLGLDNLNDYYDVGLKKVRLGLLEPYEEFTFILGDISDRATVDSVFKEYKPKTVANLAAQAGVRYSLENPDTYIQSNVIGFYNILEACRHNPVAHLVYASSSSVYGANKKVPFEETDFVDNPTSLYAATKKSNELMAYTYSSLYKIPATGLRFFSVYGPLGRPDMAYYVFADNYFRGKAIKVFNNGESENDLYRDFTYIDDITEGVSRILSHPPHGEVQHEVYNIGNNNPVALMEFIGLLEKALGNALGRSVQFNKRFEPLQPGDVPITYASIDKLQWAVDFRPTTSLEEGLQEFAQWYVGYYKLS